MKIESDIFPHNGIIPVEYTCNGNGTQPPLQISKVPKEAKSLALIVVDPDAPNGDFVHWILWNINPKTSIIEKGIVPKGAVEGYTSMSRPGWIPPCPPSGVHHYNFKLYALNTVLSIPDFSDKKDLVLAMYGYIIEDSILVGLYEQDVK